MDVIINTVTSNIVQNALDKLFLCMQSGVGFLLGEADELEKIKSSLNIIRSEIESAEERPLKDQDLVNWLEKLKDAAYDAVDVLDEYATEDLRRKVEAHNSNPVEDPIGDPVTNKVRKFTSSLSIYPVLDRVKMTKKLKEIRKRLESIEEERHKFQLSEKVRQWELDFKEYRGTFSLVDETQVYGREEDKEKMVNLLLHAVAGHKDEKFLVIPIFGMGGLGKTTLAQLFFNDDRVQNHFELKKWVCVQNDFNVKMLMRKIIAPTTGSNSNMSLDMEELQHRVRETLIRRRFLLVLDDVWNEEQEKWHMLRVLFMCGGSGSRIVVTTRSRKTTLIMSQIKPLQLERLSEEDCLKLFATRAFPDHRETKHPNLVKIGKDIVRKCGGVPLAVVTLGGLLFDKRKESEWQFVRDSELWNLAPGNVHGILPALSLSYSHLSPHLKRCFAFCAIFPKDYNMDKELLIQLWMAHGCVPSQSEKELEDVGIGILNELLARSLFQEVKKDGGGDSLKIKVHDLVHDLAQSVTGNDCCIVEPGKSINTSKRFRHLCFHQIDRDNVPKTLPEVQSLRTLLMLDADIEVPWDLTIFKNLRALDLQCSHQPPSLNSLGYLIHLRYLRFTFALIESLPESISNLQNLETLKLYGCLKLQELPKGTKNLVNLRCLDINCCDSLRHLPREIRNLSSLQILKLLVLKSLTSLPESMQELSTLRQLYIFSCPQLLSLPEWVGNLPALQLLEIRNCPQMVSLPVGLQRLTTLQSLSISECPELQTQCEETSIRFNS